MDPSKYYDSSKDDTYCVHFPNKPGYSINEITKIFSEFGEVAGVTKAGDDYGFRFVRFVREEDTLRCIEALRNHPKIKLLPKRSKQGNEQRKNWSNNQDSRETKGGWANWEQRKFDKGEHFRRDNGPKTGYQEYNNRFSNSVTTEKNGWNTEKNQPQSNFNDFNVPEINDEKELNKECETQVKKLSEEQSITIDDLKSTDLLPQEITSNNDKNPVITPNTYAGSTKSTKSSKTLVLQTVTEEAIGDANNVIPLIISDIPQLVENHKKVETKNFVYTFAPKPTTVKAEAIVVGNIHREYGIHYILHLFQKHDPISVSPMKIVTKQGLRYCIVYLQSVLQARDIEAEFDNYELSGKQLIVMRTQKLMQLVSNV